MASNPIYLDYNATTPPALQIQQKVGVWLQSWGNPSSTHWAGREPKALLREARRKVAQFIGCDPLEVVFTSGGSEGNNQVLKGVFDQLHPSGRVQEGRDQFIVSSVEHPALMKAALDLRRRGARVDVLRVSRSGELDLEELRSLLSERTALVSVMAANNETGHLFPIKKVAALAHTVGALVHTDAVQTMGKLSLNMQRWGVDFATFSGHKFYSLRGAGVTFVRKGMAFHSQILGGGQERARRAGTENVLAIAALGEMCALTAGEVSEQVERIKALRDEMEGWIVNRMADVSVVGALSPRLCNTTHLVIAGVEGETLTMGLDVKGIAASTGSACSSGRTEPSPVLTAMGYSAQEAVGSLRVSLGYPTTREEIAHFVDVLVEVVSRLRRTAHSFHAKDWVQHG